MKESLEWSGDLAGPWVIAAVAMSVAYAALLLFELTRAERSIAARVLIGITGLVGAALLLGAVLRPLWIRAQGRVVGPRVVVLLDASRSTDLPAGEGESRRDVIERAAQQLTKREGEQRHELVTFGHGPPRPIAPGEGFDVLPQPRSDLGGAIEAIASSVEEPPSALVVVSDGRLDRPSATSPEAEIESALGALDIPIHVLPVAVASPPDATVRKVGVAGAAVAHQPLQLSIEIGCSGGLSCNEIPVQVRELRETEPAVVVAEGKAVVDDGTGIVELTATLHQAGLRILEVSIEAPNGDELAGNDTRLVPVLVARDRVRVLHIAGRPTYDVRALRTWLKSDASVDVVAFFILRTPTDQVMAGPDELALIPFPVDELFTEHLPSFDAVVLQDFNAEVYGLTRHLRELARYVQKGGGLVMVGGPDAFGPGRYAGTPLSDVLPVSLTRKHENPGVDLALFEPRVTRAGRVAPVLAPLRELIGESFPEMPGTNLVGAPASGSTVLLEHPSLLAEGDVPMPVLALGEHGDGRTIALTVDGSHRLLFSSFAVGAAGRAHGAFWDAMLGWLMRDPRYEPASILQEGACIAGVPSTLRIRPLPGDEGEITLAIRKLGSSRVIFDTTVVIAQDPKGQPIELPALDEGGYAATVTIQREQGAAPSTRQLFACEVGGDEWADPRPDVERLKAIAAATGGSVLSPDAAADVPLPEGALVTTHREANPVAPPWAWALGAAVLLGAHWVARRRSGLS